MKQYFNTSSKTIQRCSLPSQENLSNLSQVSLRALPGWTCLEHLLRETFRRNFNLPTQDS